MIPPCCGTFDENRLALSMRICYFSSFLVLLIGVLFFLLVFNCRLFNLHHFSSPGFLGFLLRLQARGHYFPRPHQPNPPRHSRAGLVHESGADLLPRRDPPLRCRVRGIVLYHVRTVASPGELRRMGRTSVVIRTCRN